MALTAFLLWGMIALAAQTSTYRITFVDKGPLPFAPGTAFYQRTLTQFSPRALNRRELHALAPLLTLEDAELYAPYLDSLTIRSVTPHTPSRWRNCVLAEIDSNTAELLRSTTYVTDVSRTSEVSYSVFEEVGVSIERLGASFDDCSPMRYGLSLQQNMLVNTPALHEAGVFGQGVTVGIIDNGFRWRSNATFRNARVLAEYDVVYGDTSTANDSADVGNQDGHGTIVMSLLCGLTPDTLVGIAPAASYLLAKSEDMRGEFRHEEDNFSTAMEWLERNGADIVTASIGYRYFDSAQAETPYALLDGKTTFASRAINMATARGVVCVTAAGNDGQRPRTLITPADADSAITVGNVTTDGQTTARSSSVGPTADGRIKPDVMAMGVGVICGTAEGTFIYTGGTSMSTPQVAGCVALMKSMHPQARSYELRSALYQSCALYPVKDSVQGYGRPNVAMAVTLLGPCLSPPFVEQEASSLKLSSTVFTNRDVIVILRVSNGPRFATRASSSSPISFVLPPSLFLASDSIEVRYEIRDADSILIGSYPSDTTFLLARNGTWAPCGGTLQHGITDVAANFEPSETVVLSPLPVDRLIGRVTVSGLTEEPRVVALTTLTGDHVAGASILEYSPKRTVVGLPALAPGWYSVTITSETMITTRPLLVR